MVTQKKLSEVLQEMVGDISPVSQASLSWADLADSQGQIDDFLNYDYEVSAGDLELDAERDDWR